MKKHHAFLPLLILFTFLSLRTYSQSLYFPPLTGNTWDTVSPVSLGWCTEYIPDLIDYLEDRNSKAFLVLQDGKIVIEQYYDSFTRDSLWYWASAGKSLTAFLVGKAQEEGFLNINDTTSDYLGTSWTIAPAAKEEKITIRHQLTMTSGLDDGVPDHHCTIDTCLQYKADAGTRWAYHNGPYTLLDEVMQQATGKNLNVFNNTYLKSLTGMDGAFVKLDYNNVYFSTARSMARYGLLVLNNGDWDGNVIMSDKTYFNDMVNTSQSLNESYGYLWWLNGKSSFMIPTLQIKFPGSLFPAAPANMISALGKNGQILDVVPGENLIVVRMGNATGAGEVPVLFNDTIWQKLNKIRCVKPGIAPVLSSSSMTLYPNPAGNTVTIGGNNGEIPLIVRITGIDGTILRTVSRASQMDLSGLPDGIYFVECEWKNKREIKKLMLSRP